MTKKPSGSVADLHQSVLEGIKKMSSAQKAKLRQEWLASARKQLRTV